LHCCDFNRLQIHTSGMQKLSQIYKVVAVELGHKAEEMQFC
jgi:hypothetical protein